MWQLQSYCFYAVTVFIRIWFFASSFLMVFCWQTDKLITNHSRTKRKCIITINFPFDFENFTRSVCFVSIACFFLLAVHAFFRPLISIYYFIFIRFAFFSHFIFSCQSRRAHQSCICLLEKSKVNNGIFPSLIAIEIERFLVFFYRQRKKLLIFNRKKHKVKHSDCIL